MAKGSAKQRAVWSRMKKAARACRGKKGSKFKSCMRQKLKKKR